MNILECDGIMLDFGARRILSGVYIKVETGKITGLLGRNGAGKSCLMKIITGGLQAGSRSVRINGEPVLGDFSKNPIAYLPQHHFIPSFLTIKKAFYIYGVNPELVSEFFPELEDSLHLKPEQISGGVRRIFEVMLVTALPVKFVMLDEPFSGLMPIHIDQLKLFLERMKAHKGIFITDHFHKHVTGLADSIYLLANGQTYLAKTSDDLVKYGYLVSL